MGVPFLIDIDVMHDGNAEHIRLNGIDCPEKGQAYGTRAKQAASDLTFANEVTFETFGEDKYGRTIADVFLPDGINVLVSRFRRSSFNASLDRKEGCGNLILSVDPVVMLACETETRWRLCPRRFHQSKLHEHAGSNR